MGAYRFGRAELRPGERQLLIGGQTVCMGARAFDLLLALIERSDRIVSNSELLHAVWPGMMVEESNIQVQISAIRKVLGPEAIATIARRGYRFVRPLEPVGGRAETHVDAPAPQNLLPDAVDLPSEPAALGQASTFPHRSPMLFGRTEEITAIGRVLTNHALLTICGPGGIGKTRLAAAVLESLPGHLRRRALWVDLAPLTDAELVPGSVATALGLELDPNREPVDSLVSALISRPLLIVLDNCEHVIQSVAVVATALVARAHGTRVIATSTVPLKVSQEQVYRLGPLEMPAATASAQSAADFSAVALIVARAHAVDHRFDLSEKNVGVVIEICKQLDGIPLALELAAVRIPRIGLDRVLTGLTERFRLLTSGDRTAPARHKTMLAVFNWSYGLLSQPEQRVFRRLGVFANGFTLKSALALLPFDGMGEWEVIDTVVALVDKSLVVVDGNDPPRYRLLETARAYALQKLAQAEETEEMQRRHATTFEQFFCEAYKDWAGTTDAAWLARTEPELGNLRGALNWSSGPAGDSLMLISIASSTWPLWQAQNFQIFAEGRACLTAAVDRLPNAAISGRQAGRLWFAWALLLKGSSFGERVAALERAIALFRCGEPIGTHVELGHALLEYGRSLTALGRFDSADRALYEAETLIEDSPLPRLKGLHRLFTGIRHARAGRAQRAMPFYHESISFLDRSGAEKWAMYARSSLANVAWELGDLQVAETAFRTIADWTRIRFSDEGLIGYPLSNVAGTLIEQGRLADAEPLVREAHGLLRMADDKWVLYDALSLRLAMLGRLEDAARLEGFVDAMYEAGGHKREPNEQRMRTRVFRLLQDRVAGDDLHRLLHAGARLGPDEAHAIAL